MLLAQVPRDGSAIGNTSLRNALGWPELQYDEVRQDLVADGTLRLGQGRGGSVRLAVPFSRLTDEETAAYETEILSLLPPDGTGLSTRILSERIGWPPALEDRIVSRLLDRGILARSRGGGVGGALRRTDVADDVSLEPNAPIPEEGRSPHRGRETDTYPGFLVGLQKWARTNNWAAVEVEQTAHQGRRDTGGPWTRPDFVLVAYKNYDYTPGRIRDIETFEVKLHDCTIDAVFETAAHSRFSTRSYLAVQRRNGMPSERDLSRIESECQRFGLGLLLFDDPAASESWDFRVKPVRQEPDPDYLEEFVRQQLSDTIQAKLRKWLH